MVKKLIDVEEEFWKKVKITAIQENISINQVVENLIKKNL